MIAGINESKTLTKHISGKCKCNFNGGKCNSYQKWNNNKCWCECKNKKKHRVCEKDYIWNPATCSCKNDKYLGTIIDNPVITVMKLWKKQKQFQQILIKNYNL